MVYIYMVYIYMYIYIYVYIFSTCHCHFPSVFKRFTDPWDQMTVNCDSSSHLSFPTSTLQSFR